MVAHQTSKHHHRKIKRQMTNWETFVKYIIGCWNILTSVSEAICANYPDSKGL